MSNAYHEAVSHPLTWIQNHAYTQTCIYTDKYIGTRIHITISQYSYTCTHIQTDATNSDQDVLKITKDWLSSACTERRVLYFSVPRARRRNIICPCAGWHTHNR